MDRVKGTYKLIKLMLIYCNAAGIRLTTLEDLVLVMKLSG